MGADTRKRTQIFEVTFYKGRRKERGMVVWVGLNGVEINDFWLFLGVTSIFFNLGHAGKD